MKLKDKRELYRIFGKYAYEGMSQLPDGDLVGL